MSARASNMRGVVVTQEFHFSRARRVLVLVALCWWGVSSAVADPLGRGWEEIGFNNYRGAAVWFEQARQELAAGSAGYWEATFGLGLALQHRQPDTRADKERAGAMFDEVIAGAAGASVQAMAMMQRARLADQVDFFGDRTEEVVAAGLYERLVREWPGHSLAALAALYRAQLAVFSMEAPRAREGVLELRGWLEAHPGNWVEAQQWMLIGLAHMQVLGEPMKAVEAFEAAEKAGLPPNMKRDLFYWRLANLAERAGDKERAARYYRRIIEEVQRTGFAFEAQMRLRAMGVEPPALVDPFVVEKKTR